jgi:hypothetical protein
MKIIICFIVYSILGKVKLLETTDFTLSLEQKYLFGSSRKDVVKFDI